MEKPVGSGVTSVGNGFNGTVLAAGHFSKKEKNTFKDIPFLLFLPAE